MTPLMLALVSAGILSQADAERIERTLDPDAARLYSERLLTESFQMGLSRQERRIIAVLDDTQGQPTVRQLDRLWLGEDDLLWTSVGDDIRSIAINQAVTASISAADPDMWKLVNEEVLAWVDDYYLDADAGNFGSIPNLNQTSKTAFANAFRDWQRGELATAGYQDGLPQLIRAIEPIFGIARSQVIAITETTRIHSFAEIASGNANPHIEGWVYNSVNDDRVTELCRSAHGTVMMKGEGAFPDGLGPPPRHVRCRSFITSISGGAIQSLRAEGLIHG